MKILNDSSYSAGFDPISDEISDGEKMQQKLVDFLLWIASCGNF